MEWLLGISAAIGAIASIANAVKTNKMNNANIEMAKETNAQSVELANTSHQREVADLRSAGLSSYANLSGASAPTLTAPQNDVSSMSSALGGVGDSFNGIANMSQSVIAENHRHEEQMMSIGETIDNDAFNREINAQRVALEDRITSVREQLADVDMKKQRVETDNAISQEERNKELHRLRVESESLDNELKSLQSTRDELNNNILQDSQEYIKQSYRLKNQLDIANINHLNMVANKVMQDMDIDKKQYFLDFEYKHQVIDSLKHKIKFDWASLGASSATSVIDSLIKSFLKK